MSTHSFKYIGLVSSDGFLSSTVVENVDKTSDHYKYTYMPYLIVQLNCYRKCTQVIKLYVCKKKLFCCCQYTDVLLRISHSTVVLCI